MLVTVFSSHAMLSAHEERYNHTGAIHPQAQRHYTVDLLTGMMEQCNSLIEIARATGSEIGVSGKC